MQHAARLRRVVDLDGVADPAQAERAQRGELALVGADARALLLDDSTLMRCAASPRRLDRLGAGWQPRRLAVGASVSATLMRVSVIPSTWAMLRPRSVATSAGVRRPWRPSTVALTRLIGFCEPRLLERMSWMPGELEHRAHAAAGDDAGAGRRRLEEDAAGAEAAGRLVGDRRAVLGHAEERLLRRLDALLDRERDLVGLAVADADDVALVADDDQRREREAASALDDLGDAVDLDDALLEVESGGADCSIDSHRDRQG